jgi:nitrate reductase gamma subunit
MVLQIAAYTALLVLILGVLVRIRRLIRLPVHLRWELYPVPSVKGRAHYGGSNLEEVNWWSNPHKKDRFAELLAMGKEIVLLKGVWDHNRPLWLGSFSLHFGLYLLSVELAGLIILSMWSLSAPGVAVPGLFSNALQTLAWVGCCLGILGALIMLARRLGDPKLRPFNTLSHYFNLLILGGIYLSGLIWIATDRDYLFHAVRFIGSLLQPGKPVDVTRAETWHVGFILFFFVYFPFTHMTHAFVKYFTYHSVRWDEKPNLPDGKLQAKIVKLENQKVTWAAPHIQGEGKKDWTDLVSEKGQGKNNG